MKLGTDLACKEYVYYFQRSSGDKTPAHYLKVSGKKQSGSFLQCCTLPDTFVPTTYTLIRKNQLF